jgi:hypothetical protein
VTLSSSESADPAGTSVAQSAKAASCCLSQHRGTCAVLQRVSGLSCCAYLTRCGVPFKDALLVLQHVYCLCVWAAQPAPSWHILQ